MMKQENVVLAEKTKQNTKNKKWLKRLIGRKALKKIRNN